MDYTWGFIVAKALARRSSQLGWYRVSSFTALEVTLGYHENYLLGRLQDEGYYLRRVRSLDQARTVWAESCRLWPPPIRR